MALPKVCLKVCPKACPRACPKASAKALATADRLAWAWEREMEKEREVSTKAHPRQETAKETEMVRPLEDPWVSTLVDPTCLYRLLAASLRDVCRLRHRQCSSLRD